MKKGLKLILGIIVVVIIVAGISIMVSPSDEQEITGAAVSEGVPAETASNANCPTGESLETLNECKIWDETGEKTGSLEDIEFDDLVDKFCDKVISMYPNC